MSEANHQKGRFRGASEASAERVVSYSGGHCSGYCAPVASLQPSILHSSFNLTFSCDVGGDWGGSLTAADRVKGGWRGSGVCTVGRMRDISK